MMDAHLDDCAKHTYFFLLNRQFCGVLSRNMLCLKISTFLNLTAKCMGFKLMLLKLQYFPIPNMDQMCAFGNILNETN